MSFLKNIKDWFTDLLGATIMGISTYYRFVGHELDNAGWLTCLAVGFVLLWVPDDIILKHLKKKVKDKIE